MEVRALHLDDAAESRLEFENVGVIGRPRGLLERWFGAWTSAQDGRLRLPVTRPLDAGAPGADARDVPLVKLADARGVTCGQGRAAPPRDPAVRGERERGSGRRRPATLLAVREAEGRDVAGHAVRLLVLLADDVLGGRSNREVAVREPHLLRRPCERVDEVEELDPSVTRREARVDGGRRGVVRIGGMLDIEDADAARALQDV